MRKRIFTRLAAGLLCGALLLTDAASLNVWAVSNDLNAGQVASLEEPASTAETDEEEPENPDQETDKPEGDEPPVKEDDEEIAPPVEEEQESVPENATEEEQDSASEDTSDEEENVNSAMTASEEIIASGTSNDISWKIDADGKLTVSGTGDWERIENYHYDSIFAPWHGHAESIKTAVVTATDITDTSYMFAYCENLTSINLAKFDTSKVTDMSSMFEDCARLTSLDVSNFDTSKVTNMSSMFLNCARLTSLDVSHFNTSKVTDMSGMFQSCGISSLDLSNFNTICVTDMSQMFDSCGKITKLDLSNFNTENVTNMRFMFCECFKLSELNVSNFDTCNVTDMSGMFSCPMLSELDLSSFDTGNVTNMNYMFDYCTNLTTIHTPRNVKQSVELPSERGYKWHLPDGTAVTELPKNLVESIVLKKTEEPSIASGTSNDISWVIYADGNLKVSGTGDFKRIDGKYAPWYDHRNSIKAAEIDVFGVTNASYMFADCTNLTELDLSDFNTNRVTDMNSMFSGCTSLTTLDLSDFNTDSVTNMSSMFSGCTGLTSLDLSNFNTGNVTNMSSMFSGCTNLTTLDLSNFDTGSVTDIFDFNDCENLTDIYTPLNLKHSVSLPSSNEAKWYRTDGSVLTELPKNLNYSVVLKKNETPSNIASGTSGKISWVIDADRKLTVSGSGDFERDGWYAAPWYDYNDSIRTAEVTVTGITDTSYMFAYCENLTSIDLKSFNTGSVTDMRSMFSGCTSLTSIDLKNFNTGSVTDMRSMFSDCTNLTTLDVSSFDTSKVTDMAFMFSSCENLSTLDLSNFNTENVTNMCYMFYWCTGLTTVNVSSFDTGKVTDMCGMFDHCYSLKMLDVRSFNTENVTDMERMFHACASVYLTTLDLSSFDVGNVINMTNMITSCPFLTKINTPRNVKQIVDLPTNSAEIKWYLPDGTEVTILPQNLDYSVVLSIKKPNSDPKDDDGVLPEDIPEGGVIPKGLWISEIADHTYTGTAIKPEVRVYDGDKRLKQGTDYTLSYQNNTKAALAGDDKPPTVVVKSKGNYAGTDKKTFTITKRDISDTYVIKTFADAYAPLTNGNNPNLVFSAKCNNKALKKNTDYTLTVKDNAGNVVTSYAAVGTYTAVVKGAGNYSGEYSFPFEVLNKVPVSKLKISKIPAVNYDGTSKTPEPVIKYGKVTLNKGTDYTLSYLNNTAIGTATIIITGIGDYFGTRNVTFSITGLPIKQAKFTGFINSFPYTGDKLYQNEAVLTYGAEKLVQGTDYTVSYSNCQDKGKAAVTYTGIGKYTGTIKKTYSITAYNIKTDAQKRIKLSTDNISAVYAKGGAKPSLKVYDGTRLLTEGKDYTLSYQNNAAVTTSATVKQPTITVNGKGNYMGALSEKRTFAITAKDIAEVTVTAQDVAASTKVGKYKSTPVLTDTDGKKLKAGTDYDKSYTYTYKNTTEKVLNNRTEVTRNAGDPVDAKDIVPANAVLCVRIKAKEGSNYTGETTVEYHVVASLINRAKITVKNPAQNNANLFPYTGQAIRLDKSNLEVKVGKDVLSDDQYEIIEDTYKNNVGKGTASVQIRGVRNYGGTATVKFKIGTKGFQWINRLFG